MKVAVAADGEGPDAPVSMRAARAPYFQIYEDGKLVEVIRNPFAIGGGGAGWSVAYMLAQRGVNVFVAGNAGPNLQMALSQQGIRLVIVPPGTPAQKAVASV